MYLAEDAALIRSLLPPDAEPPGDDEALFLGYAVFMRAKGLQCTATDVHDTWVAWMLGRAIRGSAARCPEGRSALPLCDPRCRSGARLTLKSIIRSCTHRPRSTRRELLRASPIASVTESRPDRDLDWDFRDCSHARRLRRVCHGGLLSWAATPLLQVMKAPSALQERALQ